MANISNQELNILELWKRIGVKTLLDEERKEANVFIFTDGPPFVSSESLHYGHTLVSFIKDTIVRYMTMLGYKVEMILGYDCHGLPIEDKMMKMLELKTVSDIENYGIGRFNKFCKDFVYKCEGSWINFFDRIGRWVSKENNYKTMDKKFMESVWHVFKQIYNKRLVYRGYKVMPYSTGCQTPLSNFEANLNYREVKDTAITVAFPLKDDLKTSMLAWTTTPWTLPSNMALCVNSRYIYVKVLDKKTQNNYILAKDCLNKIYSKKKKNLYIILEEFKGEELKGKEYVPLFNYLEHKQYMILTDNFVGGSHKKKDAKPMGTGIVHIAPAFGEDDYNVCIRNNVISKYDSDVGCLIDTTGNFKSEIKEYSGLYIKDANPLIIRNIKNMSRLIKKEEITHNYPYCWRTDTPLIYMMVPSVFVAIQKIKEDMIANNQKTIWTPEHIKDGRFGKWLEGAKDWGISRNRFFGTPIPLWVSEDGKDMHVIGSIEELKKISGRSNIDDIHMEFIDDITFVKDGKVFRRISDVFDCWFESGSVPFGQIHYPFENKEYFNNKEYLSDLIAEGIDQTRGWFYTLNAISTALMNKPAFKNVICSGLILASDGKKMSKKLKNYPEQDIILNKYGSDALRLYLINSPAVRGESFKFNEDDIGTLLYSKLLPWINSLTFFKEQYTLYLNHGHQLDTKIYKQSENFMDKWIIAKLGSLCRRIKTEMKEYRLYNILPHLIMFIEDLTNWYIKFNRTRIKGYNGISEWAISLSTLYKTLMSFAIFMAPFTPFLSEHMYQELTKLVPEIKYNKPSVHLYLYPDEKEFTCDNTIETTFDNLKSISMGIRKLRSEEKCNNKMPLKEVIVINDVCDMKDIIPYLIEDANALDIVLRNDLSNYVTYFPVPQMRVLGKKYRKDARKISQQLEKMTFDNGSLKTITLTIDNKEYKLLSDEFELQSKLECKLRGYQKISQVDNHTIVIVDFEKNKVIIDKYKMRVLKTKTQGLRKDAGLHPWNNIKVYYETKDDEMRETIVRNIKYFEDIFRYPVSLLVDVDYSDKINQTVNIEGVDVLIVIELITDN